MVRNGEADPVVARPAGESRPRREADGALDERPELRDALELIEGAHRRVGEAPLVSVVAPGVELALAVEAGREAVRQGADGQGTCRGRAGAVVERGAGCLRQGGGVSYPPVLSDP